MTTYSAPILNGVTLPHISEYRVFKGFRGSTTVLANGRLRRDNVNASMKSRFFLRWSKLSGTEKTTIETALDSVLNNAVSFTSPEGVEYTVTVDENVDEISFEAYMSGTIMYFRTDITLRED